MDDSGHVHVVDVGGEPHGNFVIVPRESVKQVKTRIKMNLEAGKRADLVFHGRLLPEDSSLEECGVTAGATLTVVVSDDVHLCLRAFANYQNTWLDSEGIQDENAMELCRGANAFACAFGQCCMGGNSLAVVAELVNPSPLESKAASGVWTKDAIVVSILQQLVRAIMIVSFVPARQIGHTLSFQALISCLQEGLPQLARNIESPDFSFLATATEAALRREASDLFTEELDLMKKTLAAVILEQVQLRPCDIHNTEKIAYEIQDDEDDVYIRHEHCLGDNIWGNDRDKDIGRTCRCSGFTQWCKQCCDLDCVTFLKATNALHSDSMWFAMPNVDSVLDTGAVFYKFAVASTVPSSSFPTLFVVHWARMD